MTRTVLVIAENLFLLPAIDAQIKAAGFQPSGAKGQGIVEAVRNQSPAALVVQLTAASKDPLGAVRQLRSDGAQLKVLGFCDHELAPLMDQARRAGYDEVVTNGVVSKQLGAWLRASFPA